ncbi:MAG: flavodoxin family protein [Peptococcaceae bacterium]|nr:flavodoxin family protein [Peptococcaceae bacterium]MBQ7026442.1 flavodoxin family protein [Peptococcaceae bacterium]
MKAIAINGSPRKGWNTDLILQSALKGAADAGAEVEMIHLYDLNYTGCKSCFACKLKGAEPCKCFLKDDLSPVLDKILAADVVLFGTPIYFGEITSQMHALIERLSFILMTYDDYSKKLFHGKVNCGCFYTMNVWQEGYEKMYEQRMKQSFAVLQRLNGIVMDYACCDTYQFSDYSRYQSARFNEEHKRQMRENQFPKDLEAAYQLAQKLCKGE